jgi:hypothetical protein
VIERDELLRAVTAAKWNVTAAAREANVHPATYRYWLKVHGIERPRVAARAEHHPPTAALVMELARLRRHAGVLQTNYLPGPARAAQLRANELAQRAVRAKLRAALGDQPVFGGVRGSPAPGAVRPGWGLRF